MPSHTGNIQSNLAPRAAGLSNRPQPFKQAFRALGGGGKAASTFIRQKGERLKQVGDIARQKGIARNVQQREQLTQRSAQFSRESQDKQEELQTARSFAIEDFNNFVQDKMRERDRALDVLRQRRDAMRKQLTGFVDDETLERQMEGINQLIEGGSSLAFRGFTSDRFKDFRAGRSPEETGISRNLFKPRQFDESIFPPPLTTKRDRERFGLSESISPFVNEFLKRQRQQETDLINSPFAPFLTSRLGRAPVLRPNPFVPS